jgi:PadR family transcriptional regulator, regulatory protein PadR
LAAGFGEDRSARLMTAGLDICLLALIAERDRYGYELIKSLESEGLRPVKEGSVYPMLRRMEKEGLIESRVAPSTDGPPRKYYRILPRGDELLVTWANGFIEFTDSVRGILGRRMDLDLPPTPNDRQSA